jgi:ABC-type multidrug transport system fused ATPase/permease subunit
MSGVIGDSLTHSTTVKSFAAEEYESSRLNKSLNRWKQAQYRAWITGIPAIVSRNFFTAITIASLLLITSRMYQDGSISIAVVALVQLYVIRMITATQEISEIIRDYEAVMGSAYQPIKTMLVEPTVIDLTSPKPFQATAINTLSVLTK